MSLKLRLLISKLIDIGLLIFCIICYQKTIMGIGVALFGLILAYVWVCFVYNFLLGNGTCNLSEGKPLELFPENSISFLVILILLVFNTVLSFMKRKSIGRLICYIPNGI